MANIFIDFDHELLLKINSWHTGFFDNWMWYYSQKWTWVGLYILLVAYIVYHYRKNSVWILLCIVGVFGLADWGSHELKHLIMRPRPTHNPVIGDFILIVNNYRGGAYGFPSSHACDTFSLATIIGLISRDRLLTVTMVLWATVNAYSRMYLGVHYPLDILSGTILGVIIACLLYIPIRKFNVAQPAANLNPIADKSFRISIPAMWVLTMIIISFL